MYSVATEGAFISLEKYGDVIRIIISAGRESFLTENLHYKLGYEVERSMNK